MGSAASEPEPGGARQGAKPVAVDSDPLLLPDAGDPQDPEDLALALSILQRLIDEELERADRAASRARQALTLAAGFFAIVQTVALGSAFGAQGVTHHEQSWIVGLAIAAGVLVCASGLALLFLADTTFKSKNLDEEKVIEVLSADADTSVLERMVGLYAIVLRKHREANGKRADAVTLTQGLAMLAILAVMIELAYALLASV